MLEKFLICLKTHSAKKILRRIGWCAIYVIDRNNTQDAFVLDFLFLKKSSDRCDNFQIVEEYEICTCLDCSTEDLV